MIPDSLDFMLEGIRFKVLVGKGTYHDRRTDEEGVVLLKGWPFVRDELEAIGDRRVRRMLEFGIFQGGSAVLWPMLLPLEGYVGIDRSPRSFTVPSRVAADPRWAAVELHWQTSQDDREAVRRIVAQSFDGPLDLALDDASHRYGPTKASFEVVFPRLRTGGAYVIEDWGWAHRPDWQAADHPSANLPALTNLIWELVALCSSRPDIIPDIRVRPGFVLVARGPAVLRDDLSIDSLIVARGRPLPRI
jgi:hypothetical protein